MTEHPVRSPTIDISPAVDGYIVYDPDNDLVHYLNHTAAMVLELCTGQNSADDIAATLQEAFAGADAVQDCVADCINQLRGLGLVKPEAPPAASLAVVPAQAPAVSARPPEITVPANPKDRPR